MPVHAGVSVPADQPLPFVGLSFCLYLQLLAPPFPPFGLLSALSVGYLGCNPAFHLPWVLVDCSVGVVR